MSTTATTDRPSVMLTAKLPVSLRDAIRARADGARRGGQVDATAVVRGALERYLERPLSLDTLAAGRVTSGHARMSFSGGPAAKVQVCFRMPVGLIAALHARTDEAAAALTALGVDGDLSVTDVVTAALTAELGGTPRQVVLGHCDDLLAALGSEDPR